MLELLLVVVIVGILAMSVGNWYGSRQPAAVKGTVNTIYGLLTEARTTARTNGRSVTLITSGMHSTTQLAFPTQGDLTPAPAVPGPNQQLTQWVRAGDDGNTTTYSGIATQGVWDFYAQSGPSPDPFTGVPAITSLLTGGANPGAGGQLFTGASNTTVFFDAEGRVNKDIYVFVAGTRKTTSGNPQSYTSAPVGLVLVTRANGIHAFYKPNAGAASSPWQRL
jgi:type II secretory pathway pseudopilin PulG